MSYYTSNDFYPIQRFSLNRRPSSGTELLLLARWRGEQSIPHVTYFVATLSMYIVSVVFLIQKASFIQRAHPFVSLFTNFISLQSITQLPVRIVCYCRCVFNFCLDKCEDKCKTDCLYQIPRKTCNTCYIGEHLALDEINPKRR